MIPQSDPGLFMMVEEGWSGPTHGFWLSFNLYAYIYYLLAGLAL